MTSVCGLLARSRNLVSFGIALLAAAPGCDNVSRDSGRQAARETPLSRDSAPATPLDGRASEGIARLDVSVDVRRPGTEEPSLEHEHLDPIQLAGRVLYRGENMAQPRTITRVGDHLVVLDALADSQVLMLRSSDGSFARSFGRDGAGPGEFRGPWEVVVVPDRPSRFWVYDIGLRRLTHVDIDASFTDTTRVGSELVHLNVPATVTAVAQLDSVFVALGYFTDGRFNFFNGTGARIKAAGPLPAGPERVPANVRQHAYQSSLAVRPSDRRLAVVTRHLGQIEIYDSYGETVRMTTGPFAFTPNYVVQSSSAGPVMATDIDLRFGYIDVAATEDLIFALFSGRTREGYPGTANFAEYIHVFDWNGNFRRALHLDATVLSIAVDTGGRTVYAIRHDPVPAILTYAVPEIR